MKKAILILAMVLMLTGAAWGGASLKSVGNTTNALVTTGQGWLKGLIIHTDGTNSVTVAVYDNTAASGSKLFSTFTVTTSAANRATTISFDSYECPFFTGIYVDITTSGTVTYDVYWLNM